MKTIKTSELTGTALDYAVMRCLGFDYTPRECRLNNLTYSSSWTLAGPIIERERISLQSYKSCWQANIGALVMDGDKDCPLTAAMRCLVVSKLGDTVDIPDELM